MYKNVTSRVSLLVVNLYPQITMFLPIVLATVCLASSRVLAAYDKPYYEVEDAENLFQEFVKEHNKEYDRREYFERLEIFKKNLKNINERNALFPDTVFAVNQFADLKPHELQAVTGFKLSKKAIPQEIVPAFDAPDSFDWRDHKNVVTHVKNQHHCGCCFIFSAIGNIEGQYARVHNRLLAFSEQEGLDCLESGTCGGNDIDLFMHELVVKKHKLGREDLYPPYEGKKDKCRANPNLGYPLVLNETFARMDEESMKNKLVSYGPLSVGGASRWRGADGGARAAIDYNEIESYQGGIIEPHAKFMGYGHAVLVVGYGEEGGKKFWIIKNSYGEKWGEQGYFRMVRGVGAFGIGGYVVYSTVAPSLTSAGI